MIIIIKKPGSFSEKWCDHSSEFSPWRHVKLDRDYWTNIQNDMVVWIVLKGACVCCGLDSVFIATVQSSRKTQSIQLTLKNIRQAGAEELWFGVVCLCLFSAWWSLALPWLCANACLLSLAAGKPQQNPAFCHFLVALKLLPTKALKHSLTT